MDRTKILTCAIAILLAMGVYRILHPLTKFAPDPADADWTQAVQLSRETGEPAVVLFSASWCPTCQSLSQNVLSRDNVMHELNAHYIFYHVDLTNPTPAASARARRFGVSGIPLLVRYDKDGNETARANFMDADQMIAWLKAGE
jgi:thiol:disulfide interchange protein